MTMSLQISISSYWKLSQFAAIMVFQISRQKRLLGDVYPIFLVPSEHIYTIRVEITSKEIFFTGHNDRATTK